jgi:hypothetical protein
MYIIYPPHQDKDPNSLSNHIDSIFEISEDYVRRYKFTYDAPTETNPTKNYKGYPPTDLTEPMVQYYMKACDIMKDYPNNPQELIDDYKAIPTRTLKETPSKIPSRKRYNKKGKPIDKTS